MTSTADERSAAPIPGPSAIVGEDRSASDHGATVAFLFVAGDTVGDRLAVVQALVRAFGGRMLDPTVDSVPAVFPAPSAALACARELQVAVGALRIGIHCGEPLAIENGRYFGTAVWTTARLCGRAEPGRILLSATAADLLPEERRRALVAAGSVRLRGLAEPMAVVEDDPRRPSDPETAPAADVRVVTVLGVDQVGSTALLDGLGDTAARTVHTALMDVLREAIEEHRGTEVEYGGDGLTAAFDSALSALDCATAMHRAAASHRHRFPGTGLELRAAAVSGETGAAARDALRPLLLAVAGLTRQAGPGQILVSPVTADLATDRRDHRFAPDPGRGAVLLDWHPVERDRALPPDLPEAAVFVGREQDLDRLTTAWSEVVAGARRVVLLDGPVGVGRTALAARFARLVAEQGGASVLYGRAPEVETRPLEALTDAVADLLGTASRADLRRLLGGHAPVLATILPIIADRLPGTAAIDVPAPARVATWAGALGGLLDAVAAEAPVLLVLDDLQHASPALVAAVRVLAEGAQDRRMLLLGLHRTTDGAHGLIESALRDAAARGAVVAQQSLSGLDREETGELVAAVTGSPLEPEALRTLQLGSGGRPRFVLEFALARLRAIARDDTHRAFLDLTEEPGAVDVRRLTGQVLQFERFRQTSADTAALDPPSTGTDPYPGLAPFDERTADRFFGRERMTAELVARVGTSSLSAVIGASGSGKSSLVRAGLLPALERDVLPGSSGWDVVRTVPGSRPVDSLASAIAEVLGVEAAVVREGVLHRPLGEVLDDIRPGGGRLLLVLDQAEELFTSAGAGERDRFAALLEEAVSEPGRVAVVLVLRAEFYGSWAAYPRLAELLERNHLLMRAMTDSELRRAVEEPAVRAGLVVEPALVDAIVADVAGEPGALPLLSTAMSATWGRRRGRRLTLRAYAETGGVRRAVAQLADAAYGSLTDAQRPTARALLLRLAQPGGPDSTLDLRRRAPLAEVLGLGPGAAVVLRTFVERRLVVEDDATVEVAHEALLREWPLLRGWLDEDRAGRALLQALAVDARHWEVEGRDASLLYRGARLARAGELGPEAALSAVERSFLAASVSAASDALAGARRTALRLRRLAVGLVVVLVVALVVAGVAVVQGRAAVDSATAARANAVTAQANDLAGTQQDLAGLLALAADRVHPTPSAAAAVVAAANRSPDLQRVIVIGGAGSRTAAISGDGSAAGAIDADGAVEDDDLGSGKRLGRLVIRGVGATTPVAVSSAGRYLAVVAEGELHLLDTRSGRVDVRTTTATAVHFLADDSLAELDAAGTTTSFIDPSTGATDPLHGSQDDGGLTLVSADGRTEAWSDTTIGIANQPLFEDYDSSRTHVVDIATGRQVGGTIDGLLAGMSTDGSLLAVLRDPKLEIVDASTGHVVRSVDVGAYVSTAQVSDANPAASVVFDASSSTVAFEGEDAGVPVHIMDIATGAIQTEPVPFAHTIAPPAFDDAGRLLVPTASGPAVFSPSATTPARSSSSGSPREEYIPTPRAFVATSPSGSTAVQVIPAASSGGADRYRITPSGAPGSGPVLTADPGHLFDDTTAVFSDDGRRLATFEWNPHADTGAEIVVWDAETGRRLEAVGSLASVPPDEAGLALIRMTFLTDSELAAVTPVFRPDTTGTAATVLDIWRLGPRPSAPILDADLDETQLAAFSTDGETLATLSGDALNIWSTRTGRLTTTAPVPGNTVDTFAALRFSSDGRYIITGASMGFPESVVRWQVARPQTPKRVVLPDESDDHAWAVSPDGSTIADVGPTDIEFRSFATGRVEADGQTASEGDRILAFTRDGGAVVVWDESQLALDTRSGDVAQLGPPRTAPGSSVWDDDPDVVATRSGVLTSVTSGADLMVHAYVTRAADAAERVCTIAGRDLTTAEWSTYFPGVAPIRLCGSSG